MPVMAGPASYGGLLVTSLLVLVAIGVMGFVAVRLFARFFSTARIRGPQLMDVIARVTLEPRRSLYVVSVAGKTLLVGTSEMGLSVLTELDAGVVKNYSSPANFGELVRSAWTKRRGADNAHVERQPPQAS